MTHLAKVLGVRSPTGVSGRPDARIAAIAARQRGHISRGQLRAIGVPKNAIRRRVDNGVLIAVNSQVFAVGHFADAPLQAETAALLAVRDGARLSHTTAAAVWGLLPFPPEVHIVVTGGSPTPMPGVIAHRTRHLPPADCRIRHGLPVTSPARALLESSELASARVLERAVETAVVSGVLRLSAFDDVLPRGRGRRGTAVLREIVASASTGVTRSEAERRLLKLVRDADLPDPETLARLHGLEVDAYWADARLVVETDGYRLHSTRPSFERDRVRDARLHGAGIEVLRVTWRQLEREPLAVAARIAAALARRRHDGADR